MSECKRKRYSELETKREATWIDDSNDRGPRPETRGTKFEGSTDRKWKLMDRSEAPKRAFGARLARSEKGDPEEGRGTTLSRKVCHDINM